MRSLERALGGLARKAVREMAKTGAKSITVDEAKLADYAGVKKFRYGETDEEDQVGIVTGLAWTEFGGDILTIEAITRRKFSDQFMERAQVVGMVILLGLMVFAVGNDVWKHILN